MKKPLNDTPVKGKHEKGKVKGDGGEHYVKKIVPPFYGLEAGETSAAGIAPERFGCYRRPCLNGFTPAHVGKLEKGGREVLALP